MFLGFGAALQVRRVGSSSRSAYVESVKMTVFYSSTNFFSLVLLLHNSLFSRSVPSVFLDAFSPLFPNSYFLFPVLGIVGSNFFLVQFLLFLPLKLPSLPPVNLSSHNKHKRHNKHHQHNSQQTLRLIPLLRSPKMSLLWTPVRHSHKIPQLTAHTNQTACGCALLSFCSSWCCRHLLLPSFPSHFRSQGLNTLHTLLVIT